MKYEINEKKITKALSDLKSAAEDSHALLCEKWDQIQDLLTQANQIVVDYNAELDAIDKKSIEAVAVLQKEIEAQEKKFNRKTESYKLSEEGQEHELWISNWNEFKDSLILDYVDMEDIDDPTDHNSEVEKIRDNADEETPNLEYEAGSVQV
jgi:hypothetical protein